MPVNPLTRSRLSCEPGVRLYGPIQELKFTFRLSAKMVRGMSCVTYGSVVRRSRGGDKRGQKGGKIT